MKLALFDDFVPGLVIGDRVVDASDALGALARSSPQALMPAIIERFAELRPGLEALASRPGRPLASVRLRPPLPRPGKIFCAMAGYMEGVANGARAGIDMFLKAPTAVIGPGDTIVLPEARCPIFHHEAELGVVIGRRVKDVPPERAMEVVFGYVNFMDISARGFPLEPSTVSVPGFIGKSFDTFAPLGPWITTADEIADIATVQIRLWVSGEPRHDFSNADSEHGVAKLVSFAASVTTLEPGDIIACGTNHQGIGAIQDGDRVEMEIEGLGRLVVGVADPLKRTWPRGIDRAMADRVRSRRLPPAPGA
jgi:2-keto-4-pentenoate hydratase/2-oxohepta-3-ene-1,7-dioic acid hydratase in catechol pathway